MATPAAARPVLPPGPPLLCAGVDVDTSVVTLVALEARSESSALMCWQRLRGGARLQALTTLRRSDHNMHTRSTKGLTTVCDESAMLPILGPKRGRECTSDVDKRVNVELQPESSMRCRCFRGLHTAYMLGVEQHPAAPSACKEDPLRLCRSAPRAPAVHSRQRKLVRASSTKIESKLAHFGTATEDATICAPVARLPSAVEQLRKMNTKGCCLRADVSAKCRAFRHQSRPQ